MTNLSVHYKEIDPLETVKNVTDFFISNGLSLKISDVNQSEAGTHYCHVDVYDPSGVLIGGANGKGVTKEYSLASGHAELYERFCNGMFLNGSYYWNRKIQEMSYEKYGYNLRPDEKILTFEEALENVPTLKTYWQAQIKDDPELKNLVIQLVTAGRCVGVPCTSIDGKNTIYTDPRLLLRMTRSVGMAAGNTITEGLNQGLSELVENKGNHEFFLSLLNEETHYALNLDKIENPTLQKIISNIKACGYDFYLFDLSYNSHVPTMMSLLINKEDGRLNVNFGAFPVFDIAAERVLTELYQGIKSYSSIEFKRQFQLPYKQFTLAEIDERYGNSISGEVFPASFFDHIKYVDHYNTDVFVDSNTNNEELLQYYCNLFNKLGYKVYYIDNSLSDKIHAIQIFIAEQPTEIYYQHNLSKELQYVNYEIVKQYLYSLLSFFDKIYSSSKINPLELLSIINTCTNFSSTEMLAIANILLWYDVILIGYNEVFGFALLIDLISDNFVIPRIFSNSLFYKAYKKYLQLWMYAQTQQYSLEELYRIFNEIFDYKITENDIYKCTNLAYRLRKIYIEPLNEYINSTNFETVILAHINNIQTHTG